MAFKADKISSNHVIPFTSNHASQIYVAKKACGQLETLALITCCDDSLKLSNTVYIRTYIYMFFLLLLFFIFIFIYTYYVIHICFF